MTRANDKYGKVSIISRFDAEDLALVEKVARGYGLSRNAYIVYAALLVAKDEAGNVDTDLPGTPNDSDNLTENAKRRRAGQAR